MRKTKNSLVGQHQYRLRDRCLAKVEAEKEVPSRSKGNYTRKLKRRSLRSSCPRSKEIPPRRNLNQSTKKNRPLAGLTQIARYAFGAAIKGGPLSGSSG